jgi:hypothetical protein
VADGEAAIKVMCADADKAHELALSDSLVAYQARKAGSCPA